MSERLKDGNTQRSLKENLYDSGSKVNNNSNSALTLLCS